MLLGVAYLTVRVKGEDGHTRQELDTERMVLGRSSANDITIKHSSISREHCVFYRQGDDWYVEDMGSSNGTKVNNAKIPGATKLNERDIVRAGVARLTFHAAAATGSDDEGPKAKIALDDDALDFDDDDDDDGNQLHLGDDTAPDAITCKECGAWYSVAHRLPGEPMRCPRCNADNTIPQLA